MKINMDASFLEALEYGVWGFVARDEAGSFLVATADKLDHIRTPLQAEISACSKAIEGATDLRAIGLFLKLIVSP